MGTFLTDRLHVYPPSLSQASTKQAPYYHSGPNFIWFQILPHQSVGLWGIPNHPRVGVRALSWYQAPSLWAISGAPQVWFKKASPPLCWTEQFAGNIFACLIDVPIIIMHSHYHKELSNPQLCPEGSYLERTAWSLIKPSCLALLCLCHVPSLLDGHSTDQSMASFHLLVPANSLCLWDTFPLPKKEDRALFHKLEKIWVFL